ncbi:MAG: YCF48-related protein [Gammaproteobacteria bacterium]|nr:YCF48-related protein [Gammaproteobacteria bacterium]
MWGLQGRRAERVAPGVIVAMAIILTACEAPLVLDGVERMRAQPIHRTDRYQAAARVDDHVVVVGNQGVVLRSSDKGASWKRLELEGWPALIDIVSCPDGSFAALAYEQKVYLSTDQGATWSEKVIDTLETPQSITCAPDGTLWVVGSYTSIWTSSDAGDNWAETALGEDTILTTVQFFDADNGLITGEFGIVLKTTDAGGTWERLPSMPGEFYSQEAYFADPSTGWSIGLGGSIWHTTDGAQTWTQQPTGTAVSLYGIESVDGRLYVIGGEGTMLSYRDGAWHAFDHGKPVRLYIRAIAALGGGQVLIGGVGGALHVVDTGGA